MCDTAGSAAAPTARRKNVRRNTFMRGADIVSRYSLLLIFASARVGRKRYPSRFHRHHEARSCWSSLVPFANRCLGMAGWSKAQRALLPSIRHQSVAEHPADDAGIALISAVLGKRLLVPELVRRRPIRQLEQQRGADVVGAVGRADRSAENEAVAVRGEV